MAIPNIGGLQSAQSKIEGSAGPIGQSNSIITGGDIIVSYNNQIIGVAQNFSIRISWSIRSIDELDAVVPRELIPRVTRIGFKIEGLLSRQTSLQDAALFLPPGQNLIAPYFSVGILDRWTGKVIYLIRASSIDDLVITAKTRSTVTFDISGIGFNVEGPDGPLVLPGYDGTPESVTG